MPKLAINKSQVIKAPVSKVFETISNFNTWTAWSPWLIAEPDAKVVVAEDAKHYAWEGNITGQGEMQIINEEEDQSVDIDLKFIKPWKSEAKVRFEFEEIDGSTKVSWLMDSGWPIFMFWMKNLITALIGMDYERGLLMLKDYVEDGKVHSKLDFKGSDQYSGCEFIGIKTQCTIEDLGEKMSSDFGKLGEYIKDKDFVSGEPFSIYHKYDFVKRTVIYTSGIPVSNMPADLPSGFIKGSIPATPVYTTTHTGPYEHLGNAWSAMYQFQQKKVFKMNKKIDPFETYMNDPMEVKPHELITNVHFATK